MSRIHQYFINYMVPSVLLSIAFIYVALLSCRQDPPQTIEGIVQKLKEGDHAIFDFVDVGARRKSHREIVFLANSGNHAIPLIEKAIADLIDENNIAMFDRSEFLICALVGNGDVAAYQSLHRVFGKVTAIQEVWARNDRIKSLLIAVRIGLERSVKPPPMTFLKNDILPFMDIRETYTYAYDVIKTATDLRENVKDADYRICYEELKKQLEDDSLQWDWDVEGFIWRRRASSGDVKLHSGEQDRKSSGESGQEPRGTKGDEKDAGK